MKYEDNNKKIVLTKRCPNCGRLVVSHEDRCTRCGYYFHVNQEYISRTPVFKIVCVIIGIILAIVNLCCMVYNIEHDNRLMAFANFLDIILNSVLFFGLVTISYRIDALENDKENNKKIRDLELTIEELIREINISNQQKYINPNETKNNKDSDITNTSININEYSKNESININSDNKTKILPILVNNGTIQCPMCGQKQNSNRTVCFNCGQKFTNDAPIDDIPVDEG